MKISKRFIKYCKKVEIERRKAGDLRPVPHSSEDGYQLHLHMQAEDLLKSWKKENK
jgi:hypothetical protein